jgi:hypothetical protein
MAHHTKDKGDLAVGMVIADLLINGYKYAPLTSEHLPFDLIAIDPNNGFALRKIQVRYCSGSLGKVHIDTRSTYADRNGSHAKTIDISQFDAYALYCHETNEIYYVNCREMIAINSTINFTLRLNPPKNNQKIGINIAKDYLGISRIFQ